VCEQNIVVCVTAHGTLDHEAHLTATENDDWALVHELCEKASANETNAKEVAKALRMEFKSVI
jgi:hypothetical protein